MAHSHETIKQHQLAWRREKVLDLTSKGLSEREIASTLQVSHCTVNRDLIILRQEAKDNIQHYIDEHLPAEYHNCMIGITAILKEAWKTATKADEEGDTRNKLSALELAQSCYSMKLDLLSSATVIDRALKFVEYHKSKSLPLIDESNIIEQEDTNTNNDNDLTESQ